MNEPKLVRNEPDLENLVIGDVVMIGNLSDSEEYAQAPFVYAGKDEVIDDYLKSVNRSGVYFNFAQREKDVDGIVEISKMKNNFEYTAEGLRLKTERRTFHILYGDGFSDDEIEQQQYDKYDKLLTEAGI